MPYAVIFRYTLSAALFALAACGVWLCARLWRVRRRWDRRDWLWLVTVGYLAALLQITGLRLGLAPVRLFGGALRLVPLRTTLEAWRGGRGHFAYHVLGNLAWFVPLGMLLSRLRRRCRWTHALVAGLLLSLFVETAQVLLGTGVGDVDDLSLNALGALLGYALQPAIGRR